MSTAYPGGAGSMQEFEKTLAKAATTVASFENSRTTLLVRLQRLLHANPTESPTIVVVIGMLVFGVIAGGRFFSLFNFSPILRQVTDIAILGIAQTLVILTAGPASSSAVRATTSMASSAPG